MTREAGLLGKKETGPIGFCDLCLNKAELQRLDGDPRNLCEDCIKVLTTATLSKRDGGRRVEDLSLKDHHSRGAAPETSAPSFSEEKRFYLDVIRSHATREVVDEVIRELVSKQVFHFDFMHLIENDRWFTITDLRRLAFRADPNFENPLATEEVKTPCQTKRQSYRPKKQNRSKKRLPEPKPE